MNLKTVVIITLMIMFIPANATGDFSEEDGVSRAPHSPIFIDGNTDLFNQASTEGWPGDGTYTNPILIENLQIDAEGSEYGIRIQNTSRYLKIQNCRIYNAEYRGKGHNIHLISTSLVTIHSNIITGAYQNNIYVFGSNYVFLTENNIYGAENANGIQFAISSVVTIEENTINGNKADGIFYNNGNYFEIINNTIENNQMRGLALFDVNYGNVTGNLIENNLQYGIEITYNSENIEISKNELINNSLSLDYVTDTIFIKDGNTINGRPIYQYLNTDLEEKAPLDAGMIIGLNISGLEIRGIELDYGDIFIIIHRSDNITITDLKTNGVRRPVILNTCQDVIITNCSFSDVDSAVFPAYCRRLNLVDNTVDSATYGIRTYYNWNPILKNNTITSCQTGISLYSDQQPSIMNNTISEYDSGGMEGHNLNGPTICGNLITYGNLSSNHALILDRVEDGEIESNRIGYGMVGIYLNKITTTTISENIVEYHHHDGIRVAYSGNIRIYRNLIFNNLGFGINNTNCSNTEIMHNSLIGNSKSTTIYNPLRIQAFDNGDSNEWSKDSKGNHWSDWTQPDSDEDGIVDSPYSIKGGDNYDLFPLTDSPVEFISEPVGLEVFPGNGEATLVWEDPEVNLDDQVLNFTIHRVEENSSDEVIITLPGDVHYHTDKGLTNGVNYHYQISARNRYGEGAKSPPVMVIPDGTPPEIEILIPEGGLVTNTTDLLIEWIGTDELGSVHFEWKLGISNWTAAGSNLSVELHNLTEGYHVFHLAGIDEVGNRAEVNQTILVDLTGPSAYFTNEEQWRITKETEVILEFDWSDNFGIVNWSLKVDDAHFYPNGTNNLTLIDLDEGTHNIIFKVIDLAGNIGHAGAQIMVDTTPPKIIISRPSDDLTTVDRIINATWTIVEDGSGLDVTMVKLDEGNWIESGSRSYYLLENLLSGIHTFSVKASDLAGNTGQSTVTFEIFSDDIPPETVTISGYVEDVDGDSISGVRVISDDGAETTTDSNGWFTLEVQKGIRTLTFKKSGYKDFVKNIDANQNVTITGGEIAMEKRDDDGGISSTVRNVCICLCVVPLAIFLILLLMALIKKRGKRNRPLYEE